MQPHPYAFAIVNDLFDEELDPDLFAEPAPAPVRLDEARTEAEEDAPKRRPR